MSKVDKMPHLMPAGDNLPFRINGLAVSTAPLEKRPGYAVRMKLQASADGRQMLDDARREVAEILGADRIALLASDRPARAHFAEAVQHRIDWFRVFVDLDRRGYSLGIVGATLSIPYSTMYAWRAGGEPRHREGEAIVSLWARVTARPRADAPRLIERESMSAARACR